jgi:hypothetical protein
MTTLTSYTAGLTGSIGASRAPSRPSSLDSFTIGRSAPAGSSSSSSSSSAGSSTRSSGSSGSSSLVASIGPGPIAGGGNIVGPVPGSPGQFFLPHDPLPPMSSIVPTIGQATLAVLKRSAIGVVLTVTAHIVRSVFREAIDDALGLGPALADDAAGVAALTDSLGALELPSTTTHARDGV